MAVSPRLSNFALATFFISLIVNCYALQSVEINIRIKVHGFRLIDGYLHLNLLNYI